MLWIYSRISIWKGEVTGAFDQDEKQNGNLIQHGHEHNQTVSVPCLRRSEFATHAHNADGTEGPRPYT